MKKLVAIVSAVLLSAAVYAQPTVSDPNVQLRDAKNFHAISVTNAFDVYLTQGNEEKVAVSAGEAKDLDHIIVEVKNGVLQIGWENKGKWVKGNKKLKAYISFKEIDKLKASGACNVSIVGVLKANDLLVDMSGASDLKGKLDTKQLTFDISGASDIKITGTAAKLDIEASGASSFKGFDLSTDYCNARASGASAIRVTVNKELSATASGASDIDYKGTGVIRDIKTSGASSVSRQS
jgi:hypothetical protein